MKKKLILLTVMLAIFNTGLVYGETETIEEGTAEYLVEKIALDDEVDQVELEQIEEDIYEILDELDKTIEEEKKVVDDEKINDQKLDQAIDEVLNLEEEAETPHKLSNIHIRGYNKIKNIADIVENQYKMKKQFLINTGEVYGLAGGIQNDLRYIKLEMKDIVKDDNRTIDKETYGEIRQAIDTLKKDINENDYIVGKIVKETKNYIRLVKGREFQDATRTFEEILILQEQQIDLLKVINQNIYQLKTILTNA